jgi:hypothetical protein
MQDYQQMVKDFGYIHFVIKDLFKLYSWDIENKYIDKKLILRFSFYNNGVYIDYMEESFKEILMFLVRESKVSIKASEVKNYLSVYFTIKTNTAVLFKSGIFNNMFSIKKEGFLVNGRENCITWNEFGERLSNPNINILTFESLVDQGKNH